MMVKGIVASEKRNMQCLTYVFASPDLFFSTAYKVLKSNENDGFVKCNKIKFNGTDKMMYDIEKYQTLESMLSMMSVETFSVIMVNLLKIILQVKDNGFMRCENIDLSLDKIFVDINSGRVYLIYLPIELVDIDAQKGYTMFEIELRKLIYKMLIDNKNITSYATVAIRNKIQDPTYSLEDMIEEIKMKNNTNMANAGMINSNAGMTNSNAGMTNSNAGMINSNINPSMMGTSIKNFSTIDYSNNEFANNNLVGVNKIQTDDVYEDKKDKKVKKNKGYSWIFGSKSAQLEKDLQQEEYIEPEIFILVGINTPVETNVVLDKPEMIIGKMTEKVDFAMPYNPAVSRIHCRIIKDNELYFIEDLGSSNGTFVNGHRVDKNQPMQIQKEDRIRIANMKFIIKGE